MIPESNVRNLMLREDVVEAIKEGKFHIYPVGTIDQGIEVLTGIAAGELDAEGKYPEGSINQMVQSRLDEMAELMKPKKSNDDE
jgi:predicted ATP-dependent protease